MTILDERSLSKLVVVLSQALNQDSLHGRIINRVVIEFSLLQLWVGSRK